MTNRSLGLVGSPTFFPIFFPILFPILLPILLAFLAAAGAGCSLPSASPTDGRTNPSDQDAAAGPGDGNANASANAPWVRIAYPASSSTVCGEFDVFVWGVAPYPAADPTTIHLSIDGRLVSSGPAPFIYRWKTGSGRHVLKADAQDVDGHRASDSIEVTGSGLMGAACDNPPAVVLSKPLFRKYQIVSAPVLLETEAHDDVGVTRVQFFIDGALIQEATRAPFSARWDTDLFGEGYHLVRLLATDTAGKTGKDELRIAIDRTAPQLNVMEPEDGAQLKGLVHIRATVTDNVQATGLVLSIKSRTDSPDVEIVSPDPQKLDYAWDTSALTGGRYELSFLALDGATGSDRAQRTVFVGLDDGTACTAGRPCRSGSCVDGVCCASCTGACLTCARPGAVGTCSPVISQDDPDTCAGTRSCDSFGSCRAKVGQTCAANADCISLFCADGVCCSTACAGSCQACNVPGSIGACVPVMNAPDAPSCSGLRSCDAQGQCRSLAGATCISNSDCSSGFCVGAVCCESACNGPCLTCGGTTTQDRGRCVPRAKGASDSVSCQPTQACDGAGACKSNNGQPCTGNAACWNGLCVDGVCCASACDGPCQACNTPNTPGTCSIVTNAADPDTCDAICDEQATCSMHRNGRDCSLGQICSSGHCVDGVCCDTACAGTCAACNIVGRIGVCSSVPAPMPDPPTCAAPSACDGTGVCKP